MTRLRRLLRRLRRSRPAAVTVTIAATGADEVAATLAAVAADVNRLAARLDHPATGR